MIQMKNKNSVGILFVLFYLLGAIGLDVNMFKVFDWADFPGQWAICAYTLRGTNPFVQTGNADLIQRIGTIPSDFSTSPWGCILGNLIYPGYLPIEIAQVYFLVLNLILLCVVCYLIIVKQKSILSFRSRLALLAVVFVSPSFWISIDQGNGGALLSVLLIICILTMEEHPIVSGLFLGVAMVKPQLALLFVLVMILQKKYLTVVIAAFVDLISWAVASAVTRTSPILLLKNSLSIGTEKSADKRYYGLLTPLSNLIQNNSIILLLSMVCGILFVIVIWYYMRRHRDIYSENSWYFVAASVGSYFWCYSYANDHFVLMIPLMMCFLCLSSNLKVKDSILTGMVLLYIGLEYGIIASTKLVTGDESGAYVKTLFSVGLIMAVVLLLRVWIKSSRSSAPDEKMKAQNRVAFLSILVIGFLISSVVVLKFTILRNPFTGTLSKVVYMEPEVVFYKTTDSKQLEKIQNVLTGLKTVEEKGNRIDYIMGMTGGLPVDLFYSSKRLELAISPDSIYVNGVYYKVNKDITYDILPLLTEKAKVVSQEESGMGDTDADTSD